MFLSCDSLLCVSVSVICFRSEEFRFSLGQITWPLYWSGDIAYSHFCECCCQTSCKTGKRCSFPLFFFKHKTSTCFLNVYSVSNISFPFLDLFPCLCFLSEETRNSVYMFSSTFSSMFCSFCISVCFPCRTVILFVYLYNHWLSCLHLYKAKTAKEVFEGEQKYPGSVLFAFVLFVYIYSYFYLYIWIYAMYKYTCRTPHFCSGYSRHLVSLIFMFGVIYV